MNESSTFEITETGFQEGKPFTRFEVDGDGHFFGGNCDSGCPVCARDRELFNAEVAKRFSDYDVNEDVICFRFDGKLYEFCEDDLCSWDIGVNCPESRELFAKLTAGGFDPAAGVTAASVVEDDDEEEDFDGCDYPACDCDVVCSTPTSEAFFSDLKLPSAEQRIAELERQNAEFELLRQLSIIALEASKQLILENEKTDTQLRAELTEKEEEIEDLKLRLDRAERDVKFWNDEYNYASQRESTAYRERNTLQSQLRDLQTLHTDLLFAAVTGERKSDEVPF